MLEAIADAILYFDSFAGILVLFVSVGAAGYWILKTLLRAAVRLLRRIPID